MKVPSLFLFLFVCLFFFMEFFNLWGLYKTGGTIGLVASEQRLFSLRCDGCNFDLYYTRRKSRMVRGPNVSPALHRLYSSHVLGQILPALHAISHKKRPVSC